MRKELINSFDSISSSNSYSKNGYLFEKVLSHRSLKSLIKKLKYPKKITKKSFIEEFRAKYPYGSTTLGIPDEYFIDSIYNNMKNENKDENRNKNQKEKKSINLIKKNAFKILNKKNNFDHINLDPFKYSPNYKSIDKNIPIPKFILPSKEFLKAKIKKNPNNIEKINKRIFISNLFNEKNDNKPFIFKSNNNIFDNNNNDKNIKNEYEYDMNINKQILTPINKNSQNLNNLPNINQNNKLKIIKNSKSEGSLKIDLDLIDNKNNHALRFSKYAERKDYFTKKCSDILSYINPSNNYTSKNIKTIDFNKMKPHSLKHLLNINIMKNPSICYYQPNYDAFINKKSVIFDKNKIDKKSKRKNIMKKIWRSYNVDKEYISIDNDKLDKCNNYKILLNINEKK